MSAQTDVYRAAFALLDGLGKVRVVGDGAGAVAKASDTLAEALKDAYADQAITEEDTHDHAYDLDAYGLTPADIFAGKHAHPYQAGDGHTHEPGEHDHIDDVLGAFRGAHSHEYQEADDHYHASEDGGTAPLFPGR